MDLKHAQIAAFGSTCKKGVAAAEDSGLADLIACGAPVVTIVGKTWDAQVERALQTTLEENLRMIGESVAHVKAAGRHVVFDAEHYFDGFKANRDYALACVGAAVEAGADSVDLCETNGGALPFEVEQIVAATVAAFPSQAFGIHCHNDSGCAVANTLAAVRAGATQVQGTVNGIGERVGNTDLLTVIADLELKMGAECVGRHSLVQLTGVAQYVAELCNVSMPAHHPYTGSSAFAHKGGLHASAIARFPAAYEHVSPAVVGNTSRTVVSELAGKASLLAKARSLGFDLEAAGVDVQAVLDDIKAREAAGFTYEGGRRPLGLPAHAPPGAVRAGVHAGELPRHRGRSRGHGSPGQRRPRPEATVKIHGGGAYQATGESAGPVGRPDAARAWPSWRRIRRWRLSLSITRCVRSTSPRAPTPSPA